MPRRRYLILVVSLVLLASIPIVFRESARIPVFGNDLRILMDELNALRGQWSDAGIGIPFLRLLGPDPAPGSDPR